MPKEVADTLFHRILVGVDCMHKLGEVAHLDLKLENILLTNDFRVKLCDFGFSQSTKYNCFKNLGTDGYKAPEIQKLSATEDA
jgi:calcium/calmodulin-dependent protein kinase I